MAYIVDLQVYKTQAEMGISTKFKHVVVLACLLFSMVVIFCYLMQEDTDTLHFQDFEDPCISNAEHSGITEEQVKLYPGGRYKPWECESKHRVAIIVPYRDRETHLKMFIDYIHPFLQRQRIDYGIFVIEMVQGVKFNRAILMNIGFVEAVKQYDYQCFIFHDVDLLPQNLHIRYTCEHSPVHLSSAIDSKNYTMPYRNYFGGVCAISKEHFEKINGFSNRYFDWGGEDDDLLWRNMIFNTKEDRYQTDGLNSLRYHVIKYELKPLFTWILVSVNETDIMEKLSK